MSTWAFLRLPTFYYSFKKLLDYRSFFNLSGKMFQILGPKSFQSYDTPNLQWAWQAQLQLAEILQALVCLIHFNSKTL